LWVRIKEIQQFATAANEPITNATVIRLILRVFENTGVFGMVTKKWRDCPDNKWMYNNFKAYFKKGNKECLRKLTAKAASYHGANAAINTIDSLGNLLCTTTIQGSPPHEIAAAAITPATSIPSIQTNNNITMYYCWSHGLHKNCAHTSATCNNKQQGHQDTTTADKMMKGYNTIMMGERFTHPSNA
jgi:hypothetical protein